MEKAMRNLLVTLEYDGSRYNGWQRQGREEVTNTIEYKIQEIIEKMTGERPDLYCGSRTETGIHALEQTINFKTSCPMKAYEIKNYMNRYLPMDIAVLSVEDKPERFHASLNALSRTYLCRIAVGKVHNVFTRKYTYYCFHTPDVKLMQDNAALFTGLHDFKNFSTVKRKKSTEKNMLSVEITEIDGEIQIRMTANDFLHNMPRMVASTLLDIGLNRIEPADAAKLLDSSCSTKPEMTVEAKGLFLEKVNYE